MLANRINPPECDNHPSQTTKLAALTALRSPYCQPVGYLSPRRSAAPQSPEEVYPIVPIIDVA